MKEKFDISRWNAIVRLARPTLGQVLTTAGAKKSVQVFSHTQQLQAVAPSVIADVGPIGRASSEQEVLTVSAVGPEFFQVGVNRAVITLSLSGLAWMGVSLSKSATQFLEVIETYRSGSMQLITESGASGDIWEWVIRIGATDLHFVPRGESSNPAVSSLICVTHVFGAQARAPFSSELTAG